jgi:stearoyl-CoA desaturase (delta-9 desaturase)
MNTPEPARPPVIWLNVLVFSMTFAIAAIGVPLYAWAAGFSVSTVIAAVLATGYCGMSITAGYHRLWSHRAYEAHPLVRFVYAIGGAFALQNSILHWSSDHRVHHAHVDDNERDPYSARRGFWYAHIGWMLREYQASRYHDYRNVRDLQRDPIVVWQHRHYLALALGTNFGFPLLFGVVSGDIIGSLLLVGVLRLVVSHHATFFINSLAHMWGRQPYSDRNTAKDNPLVALLTYGEGYHNFHHAFQFDYRNAIRWWQFDPTKWWIHGLGWLGLAKNLKTCPEERIQKALLTQQWRHARQRLQQLPNAEELLQRLQAEHDQLMQRLQDYASARKAWLAAKRADLNRQVEASSLYRQYRELQSNWRQQRQQWQRLVSQYA